MLVPVHAPMPARSLPTFGSLEFSRLRATAFARAPPHLATACPENVRPNFPGRSTVAVTVEVLPEIPPAGNKGPGEILLLGLFPLSERLSHRPLEHPSGTRPNCPTAVLPRFAGIAATCLACPAVNLQSRPETVCRQWRHGCAQVLTEPPR